MQSGPIFIYHNFMNMNDIYLNFMNSVSVCFGAFQALKRNPFFSIMHHIFVMHVEKWLEKWKICKVTQFIDYLKLQNKIYQTCIMIKHRTLSELVESTPASGFRCIHRLRYFK